MSPITRELWKTNSVFLPRLWSPPGLLISWNAFVVDPLVSKNLRAEGFKTKQDACKWIVENSKVPAAHFWGGQMQAGMATQLAKQGIEPFASWAKLPKDALITPRHSSADINILVVGGETNPMWITTDFMYTRSVPVDKWRPACGIRRDARPLRMPAPVTCKDGTCGIPEAVPSAEPELAPAQRARSGTKRLCCGPPAPGARLA